MALALQGGDLGGDGGPDDGSHIVYIDPIIWMEPTPTWGGFGPVTFVVPPSTLPSPLTIVIPEQTVPITRAGITTTVIVVKTTSKFDCWYGRHFVVNLY